MKALRRFTVRAHLPQRLTGLSELATNLRWSWHLNTRWLFESMDPELWQRTGQDPVRMLGEIGNARLDELAGDDDFVGRMEGVLAEHREYLSGPRWFQKRVDDGAEFPAGIAYFSMEFGVSEVLPNYSGGLGILAGDHLKAASDLGLPLIGIGLWYRMGYFRQSLTADGWQQEHYPSFDPQGLPLSLLTEPSGAPVLIRVAMPGGRTLRARVWVAQVGRVPLLLLDSDIADNDAELRSVTDRLYGGDQDHRIKQEILVGVGGVRAVRAFTRLRGLPDPTVYHLNEGHAGFCGLERIRELTSYEGGGLDFDSALAAVRASTVFTTHTPVPAGIDRFPAQLVRYYFGDHQSDSTLLPGMQVDKILEFGRESDPQVFNMAHMGLRIAQRANGVSKLHGEVSRGMFNGLWPGFDQGEVPIGSVTNGVHSWTWAAPEWQELAIREAGVEKIEDARGWELLDRLDPKELWDIRSALRAHLVGEVRRRVRAAGLERGSSAAELTWTDSVFDPNVLTIGFARRVPTYKRLTLMLRDPERLRAILLNADRPVQLIVAGKAHPADDGGKALIQQIVRFADEADVRHRIVFLPNYDMAMARWLYWGCDVWLNNPLRPLEACGTSGMKSALNGGLNLSIRDGWWDEMADSSNGWAIPTADGVTDEHRRDDLEAAALYELIENAVAPTFYDRGEDGIPGRWVEMVRHTLKTLGPKVQASRMVRDYTVGYYGPAAAATARVYADDFAGAKALAGFRRAVNDAWPSVRVVDVDASGLPDSPELGADMQIQARIDLAGLAPSDVSVQALVGRVDDQDFLTPAATVELSHAEPAGSLELFTGTVALPVTGAVGYTVRVLPKNDLLATPAEYGLVRLA